MNIKKLNEEKAEVQAKMQELLDGVKAEERAFTDDEIKLFDTLKSQVDAINKTIDAFEKSRELIDDDSKEIDDSKNNEERALKAEERDVKEFANFIRTNVLNERAGESNFSQGQNGVIVPTTIANKIIMAAVNMSPILEKATKYNTNGKLRNTCVWQRCKRCRHYCCLWRRFYRIS